MMGALSELCDKERSKAAYRIANAIFYNEIDYFELGAESVTEEEIIGFLESSHDNFLRRDANLIGPEAYHKLQQFLGKEGPSKFFFLDEWHFMKRPWVKKWIIEDAEANGMDWIERMSTDNDFFMFRPVEHGNGLEIRNNPCYSPDRLNEIFGNLVTDMGPIRFGW